MAETLLQLLLAVVVGGLIRAERDFRTGLATTMQPSWR